MTKHNEATWYADYFARPVWVADMAGPKPSLESLKIAHAFGKAGKQSLALAMTMRPAGATGSEIQVVCGAPQNNHRTKLVRDEKVFNRVPHSARANCTVYKLELNEKGKAYIARKAAVTEAAKPADKGKGKPATVKAAKPVKSASKPRKAVKAPLKPLEAMQALTAALPVGDSGTVPADHTAPEAVQN